MRQHRISSGAIILEGDRVLLVRHYVAGQYDFWVAPGGGVLETEDILTAAAREAKEETGLNVEAVKPIYIEQFYQPKILHIKTWILCRLVSGKLSVEAPEAAREHIVEAKYFDRKAIQSESKPIFPKILKGEFWEDFSGNFPEFKFLGIREMEFY